MGMRAACLVLSCMAFCVSADSPSKNAFKSGNKLMDMIGAYERSKEHLESACLSLDCAADYQQHSELVGYVLGVSDTLSGISVCPDNNVTGSQEIAIVAKYLRENPEQWNRAGADVVGAALRAAMPCETPRPSKH